MTKIKVNTNIINTLNAIPAAGKTQVAIDYIADNFGNKFNKVLYVLPTKNVIEEVYKRLSNSVNKKFITKIYGDDSDYSVQKNIVDYMVNQPAQGILMITSAACMLLSDRLVGFDLVVIDEELASFSVKKAKLQTVNLDQKAAFEFFFTYVNYKKTNFPKLLKLTLNHSEFADIDKQDDGLYDFFKDILTELEHGTFDMFINEDEYEALLNGSAGLHIMKVLNPKFFTKQKEVLYLGYDLENTLSSLVYRKVYGFVFKQSELTKNLRFINYSNPVEITYMFAGKVGKQTIAGYGSKKEGNKEAQAQIINFIKENDWNKDCLYRKNIDLGEVIHFENSHQIEAMPHGINKPEWMSKTKITILNLFYLNPVEASFLKLLGYSKEEIENGRNVNMIVQQITRSAIRHNNGTPIKVFVLNEDTALGVAKAFKNSTLIHSGEALTKKPNSNKLEADMKKFCDEAKRKNRDMSKRKAVTKEEKEAWSQMVKKWHALTTRKFDLEEKLTIIRNKTEK